MNKGNCYFCGLPATSDEHSPARGFFPKAKRVNLITVASCREHNEDTSKDDEYVRNVIAMSIGNNALAFQHFLDKCIRSFQRSPALMNSTIKNAKKVYTNETGIIQPTFAFEIDRDRIDKVMRKIAYGVFFKEYNEPWNRRIIIMTDHFKTSNMSSDDFGFLIQTFKKLIQEHPFDGQNPTVFKYRFLQSESDSNHDQVLRMIFYEGFEVWVAVVANSEGPSLS